MQIGNKNLKFKHVNETNMKAYIFLTDFRFKNVIFFFSFKKMRK